MLPYEAPKTKTYMLSRLPFEPVKSRLAARNTLDYIRPDGRRVIRLHDTDILTFNKTAGFEIDTGGFNTVTTRARLNEFLPKGWHVSTEKGRIHISGGKGLRTPFNRRVRVTGSGRVVPDSKPADMSVIEKQITAFINEWKKRGCPKDAAGDPWVFPSEKTLKYDREYVLSWMREKYVFATFLYRANLFARLPETGAAISVRLAMRDGLRDIDLRRLRRFCRACVGLEC